MNADDVGPVGAHRRNPRVKRGAFDIGQPMPLAPPVMTATLSLKSFIT